MLAELLRFPRLTVLYGADDGHDANTVLFVGAESRCLHDRRPPRRLLGLATREFLRCAALWLQAEFKKACIDVRRLDGGCDGRCKPLDHRAWRFCWRVKCLPTSALDCRVPQFPERWYV